MQPRTDVRLSSSGENQLNLSITCSSPEQVEAYANWLSHQIAGVSTLAKATGRHPVTVSYDGPIFSEVQKAIAA